MANHVGDLGVLYRLLEARLAKNFGNDKVRVVLTSSFVSAGLWYTRGSADLFRTLTGRFDAGGGSVPRFTLGSGYTLLCCVRVLD